MIRNETGQAFQEAVSGAIEQYRIDEDDLFSTVAVDGFTHVAEADFGTQSQAEFRVAERRVLSPNFSGARDRNTRVVLKGYPGEYEATAYFKGHRGVGVPVDDDQLGLITDNLERLIRDRRFDRGI